MKGSVKHMATQLNIRPYFDGTHCYRIVDTDSIEPINYYVNHIILPNTYEKNKSHISFYSRIKEKRCVVSNGLVSVMSDKDVNVILFDNGVIAFYNKREMVLTLDLITFKKFSLPTDLIGHIEKVYDNYILLDCGKIFFTIDITFTDPLIPFKFKAENLKLSTI